MVVANIDTMQILNKNRIYTAKPFVQSHLTTEILPILIGGLDKGYALGILIYLLICRLKLDFFNS